MSKAVLVMDMPKCCDECCVRQINLARCQVTGKSTSHHSSGKPMDERKRPDWCPLKPMPEKMNCPPMNGENYEAGWNACIYAICGEEKAGDRD